MMGIAKSRNRNLPRRSRDVIDTSTSCRARLSLHRACLVVARSLGTPPAPGAIAPGTARTALAGRHLPIRCSRTAISSAS